MCQDILDPLKTWCYVKRICLNLPHLKSFTHQDYGTLQKWALDIVGPLTEDKLGKKYIITAINYFTFWPEIVARFGRSKQLITDRGPKIVGNSIESYLINNALEQEVTTPPSGQQALRTPKWLTGTTSCQALLGASKHRLDRAPSHCLCCVVGCWVFFIGVSPL
ncbi:hypothetical protein DSO57_1011498 [Entomophthora muscae]|uniref:Uncharacterized protein n=1 Tax=Entomophthora muscae TaxID=34485 RepID=A0ACC2TTM8_9FUNG|nr:hypothetical protein DSO57_1011498 [Entomophthora muscae]